MPTRPTERRIPPTLTPGDLGESVAAGDARCLLVSFITSPLVVERLNTYVVFVTDDALAAATARYEWKFAPGEVEPETQVTDAGEATYRPKAAGELQVSVRLVDEGGAEQATLTLPQEVVDPNPELEALIAAARNQPGPSVGNPEVARELVNDHNPYYQAVTLTTPENTDAFREMVFSMVFDGAQQRSAARRAEHLARLATALNGDDGDFATLTGEGAGVCGVRLPLLAMTVGRSAADATPPLDWTELPDVAPRRASADEGLRERLAGLEAASKVDLFNIARFPKSNITHCARIVEQLRDRYFRGASFEDVVNGLSGTRAHWIVRHFREGPLVRV
jgi:hypothetical protein